MTRKTVRILLVNEVPLFRELEGTLFRRHNYEISTAESGIEALEKALRLRPQLVLLDCNLRGMDGFECCRRIKSHPILKLTKTIIITAHGRMSDRERCRQAGCDDFLTKPIDRRLLLSCIERNLAIQVRVTNRAPVAAKLIYSLGDEPEETSLTGNLSVGGAFVLSETPPAVGRPLQFIMELAGVSLPIEADAEVVWNTSLLPPGALSGFGLKFTRIDLDAVRLIERYVESRL